MRTLYAITALFLGATPTLAAAEEAPAWSLHGFGDVSVKNDYVTPRGVVVTTKGATVQVLTGLALSTPSPVSFYSYTWTDLNPGYGDVNNELLNEFDFAFGVSAKVAKGLTASAEYVQFTFPAGGPFDQHNIEFALKYADTPKGGFSFNPYAKLFWAVDSKSSTVGLGKPDNTFDVELGLVPTYSTGDYTVSAPTWITVGPESYWGDPVSGGVPDGNVGIVSTGLKVSAPLKFLKGGAGASVYAFGQYYHLVNDNLVTLKSILNSGDHKRDHVVFGGGLSFGF